MIPTDWDAVVDAVVIDHRRWTRPTIIALVLGFTVYMTILAGLWSVATG